MPTFSGGANYEFTDHMSAYVRINNGVELGELRRCPLQQRRLPEQVAAS